jgi:hypothetical protein
MTTYEKIWPDKTSRAHKLIEGGFWRSPTGENHGTDSRPGDVWINPGDIHDTDRLEWVLKYGYAKTLAGALESGPGGPDFIYVPIRDRKVIDAAILKGRQSKTWPQ